MIEQINHLAQLWWSWTSAMFLQVGLLIILVALIDLLIRRWAWPQLRYALWSLILIKLVLSPALSLPTGLAPKLRPYVTQVLNRTVNEPAVTSKLPPTLPFLNDRITQAAVQSEPHIILAVEDIPTAGDSVGGERFTQAAGPRLDWRVHAVSLWLLGAVTLSIWLLVKLRRLGRGHPAKSHGASLPQSFHDQLAQCAGRLKLRRRPMVVVTDKIQTPAVFGLFRPVLLMPVGYIRNLSRKDTEYLLLHELAHIKRGDLFTHSLYIFLQVVYWYNPLLWLVRRRLRHLRELCCDATVAGLLRDRTPEYRRTLLEAARQFLCTPVEYGLGLVGLFEDSNCLISRINRLEKPIWRCRRMKNAVVITIVALLLACVLPMAQARQDPVRKSSSSDSPVAADNSSESSTSSESEREPAQDREQLLKARQDLQAKLRKLELEMQKLQHELREMSHAEHQASHQAHQAGDHAAQAKLKAEQAKDQAAKAADKARKAKDKSAKVKALAETKMAGAQAQRWEQWAKQMEKWGQGYEEWAESDEFKQWEKDIEKWAQGMAQAQMRTRGADPNPTTAPKPMPVMPPMPSMPVPVAPTDRALALPKLARPAVSIPEIGIPGKSTGSAPILSDIKVEFDMQNRHVEVHDAKDGKHVSTMEMHFVTKVEPGKPFVVRKNVGTIVLRPSKDGKCDVKAMMRGKAKTSAEAQAKVEQVVTALQSSQERYYLEPVRDDGGKWDDLNVDLHIMVPPGILLDVKTNLGSVELYDLEGKVRAATDMGTVKAVNTTGEMELFTKMGSIEFIAPKDLSAKLHAQTKMGSVECDLPLEISRSGMFHKVAQGTLGSGQNNIRMTTNMGSINLKWYSPAQDSPGLY